MEIEERETNPQRRKKLPEKSAHSVPWAFDWLSRGGNARKTSTEWAPHRWRAVLLSCAAYADTTTDMRNLELRHLSYLKN